MRLILVFCAIVICAGGVPTSAAYWNVEQVYNGGFASGDASLVLDSAGVPSISYSADGNLYLAARSANGWWSSSYVAYVGYMGGWSSLGLNRSGQPCIAYVDGSGVFNLLKYAYKSTTWSSETIADVGWLPDAVSLAYDQSGNACLAYCRDTGTQVYLSFARRTATNTWAKEDVSVVDSVTGPSMCIDASGLIRITFVDSDSGQLKIASKSVGGAWQIGVIDGSLSNQAIGYSCITLQSDGTPSLAYFLSTSVCTYLKYATPSGSSWTCESVAPVGDGGYYQPSVGVRPGGMPRVGYFDPDVGFAHAWKLGTTWLTEPIDTGLQTGTSPCLKFDSLGSMHVSYFDNWNYNVKYAYAATPIQDAKALPDGQAVRIAGVVASSASGELNPRVYVQELDGTCGIQINFPSTIPTITRGDSLDVQGTVATVNGERVISNPVVTNNGHSAPPTPIGARNASLGGGNLYYVSGSSARGQRGITGAVGLNNMGLLVAAWGAVGYIDSHTFTLDDGSGAPVKCVTPISVTVSPLWHFANVRGISSCETSGSELHRLLRVRSLSDIRVVF